MKTSKQTYQEPSVAVILLENDDIITLSSILEPDYEEETEEIVG